jgi:hypothetical protein
MGIRVRASMHRESGFDQGDERQDDKGDLGSAAGMETGVESLSVMAIVFVGITDGDPLIDVIGIGTNLGMAGHLVRRAPLPPGSRVALVEPH